MEKEIRIYEREVTHCITCPAMRCDRIKGKRYSASRCIPLRRYICNNSTDIPTQQQEKDIYKMPYNILPDCPLKKKVNPT